MTTALCSPFGTQHSFPLEQMFSLVPSGLARDVLVAGVPGAPFFGTRWRWNVTRAFATEAAPQRAARSRRTARMRAAGPADLGLPAQTRDALPLRSRFSCKARVRSRPAVRRTAPQERLHEHVGGLARWDETEHLLEREAVLRAKGEHNAVVIGRGLQFEVERPQKRLRSASPRPG